MPRTTPTALLSVFALLGCSSSISYARITTNSVILERHNDGPVHAAYYEDGAIHGADAGLAAHVEGNAWIELDRCVDHPSIPRWRDDLRTMQQWTTADDAAGAALVRAARGFPFRAPVRDCLSAWSRDQPARAATILDHVDGLDLDDDFAESLARCATRDPSDDARIANWIRELIDDDHDEAVLAALAHPNAGEIASRSLLAYLDDLHSRLRRQAFDAAARRLIDSPSAGVELMAAVEELDSDEETAAVLDLLAAHPDPNLAGAALRTIDDRRSADRRSVFAAAAPIASRDPVGLGAVVHGLGELKSRDRCAAAMELIDRDDLPATVGALLLNFCGDLPARDRANFVEAALASPHGDALEVRRAAETAVRRDVPSRERKRLLETHFTK